MLTSHIGVHLFHHHEASAVHASIDQSDRLLVENAGQDCPICSLDSFQEVAILSLLSFVFFALSLTVRYKQLTGTEVYFSRPITNKGPPVTIFL